MRYELYISEEAREQLRGFPKHLRKSIGIRLDALQNDFSGDVKS
jgi:phage-related protein